MALSFDSYLNILKEQKRKDDEKIKNVEEKCQNRSLAVISTHGKIIIKLGIII